MPSKKKPASNKPKPSSKKTTKSSSVGKTWRFMPNRAVLFACFFAITGVLVLVTAFAFNGNESKLEKFKNNHARGWIWDGLEEAPAGSPCAGLLQPKNAHSRQGDRGNPHCTHGPDPAPPGIDVRNSVEPIRTGESDATAAETGITTASSVMCDGDGQSGKRVQGLYVRASDVPSRYAAFASSFQVYATNIDNTFIESSNQTGGPVVRPRWVHDAACNVVVPEVVLSPTGDDNWSNTWSELRALGYNRTDRKYVLWEDANVYCGIGDIRADDSSSSANQNNGGPSFARSDSGCWNYAEAHELMHNLGGVQLTAPHTSAGWHCTDEYDLMCYSDGAGVTMTYPCTSTQGRLFDCNKDDYFYAGTPPAGNYLATHWNAARSAYLIGGGTVTPPPPPPGDSVAPTALVTQPVNGSTIGNKATVVASGQDNVGITKMELFIDGQLKGTSSSGSISYNWNSRKASRGIHTITVKAYDAAGNMGQSSISVIK